MQLDAIKVLAEAPISILVLEGPDLRIAVANAEWRELFGYHGSEGVAIAELNIFDDSVLTAIETSRDTAETIHIAEARCHQDHYFSATIRAVAGENTLVIVVCRDVTGEVAVRRELERTSQVKDQLIATVSHELRAPVTTLLLWERLLRDAPHDREARDRALEAIRESAARQSRLVSDLLDVSRAINGKLGVELVPIEIAGVLRKVIEEATIRGAAANITVEDRVERDLGRVLADPSRIYQVLDNILSNALKFTPPAGRIMIAAYKITDVIMIELSDTGCGIAPDVLAQVFEPFVQGHDAIRGEGGLGLGLAIARELVALHGGSIAAHSDGEGRGARFTVRLPVARAALRTAARARLPIQLHDVRILVIDDDDRVLGALRMLLERVGAHVDCVRSAAEAWNVLVQAQPDVVVSDISMPDEDGYAFVQRIRASEVTRDVPTIALTALAGAGERDRALAAGFDMHISKPVDIDALVTGIARVIAMRKPTRPA